MVVALVVCADGCLCIIVRVWFVFVMCVDLFGELFWSGSCCVLFGGVCMLMYVLIVLCYIALPLGLTFISLL